MSTYRVNIVTYLPIYDILLCRQLTRGQGGSDAYLYIFIISSSNTFIASRAAVDFIHLKEMTEIVYLGSL